MKLTIKNAKKEKVFFPSSTRIFLYWRRKKSTTYKEKSSKNTPKVYKII